jgi:hypothetical protein
LTFSRFNDKIYMQKKLERQALRALFAKDRLISGDRNEE